MRSKKNPFNFLNICVFNALALAHKKTQCLKTTVLHYYHHNKLYTIHHTTSLLQKNSSCHAFLSEKAITSKAYSLAPV